MTQKITKTVQVSLTSLEVAELIANADSTFQAEVLTHLADITEKWEHPVVLQLQYVHESCQLSDQARALMKLVGEYA